MQKQPRHYTAEIIALPTRAQRAEALAAVPEHYQAWVRDLIQDHFWKRGLKNRRQAAQ